MTIPKRAILEKDNSGKEKSENDDSERKNLKKDRYEQGKSEQ